MANSCLEQTASPDSIDRIILAQGSQGLLSVISASFLLQEGKGRVWISRYRSHNNLSQSKLAAGLEPNCVFIPRADTSMVAESHRLPNYEGPHSTWQRSFRRMPEAQASSIDVFLQRWQTICFIYLSIYVCVCLPT